MTTDDRETFEFEGRTYRDMSPLHPRAPRAATWRWPTVGQHIRQATCIGVAIWPEKVREEFHCGFVAHINGDTAMNVEIDTPKATKKSPAKVKASPKAKAKGATTATKFSLLCRERGLDSETCVKVRRRLRAEGLKAPYLPNDKKVLAILDEFA